MADLTTGRYYGATCIPFQFTMESAAACEAIDIVEGTITGWKHVTITTGSTHATTYPTRSSWSG